jgi:hypothetical protein
LFKAIEKNDSKKVVEIVNKNKNIVDEKNEVFFFSILAYFIFYFSTYIF